MAGTSLQTSAGSNKLYTDSQTTTISPNYIVGSGSSANTAVGSLTNINGESITLTAGLSVLYKMDSTFQAGANTFNLNGHGADAVTTTSLRNLKTIVLAGAILPMTWDGTRWQVIGFI